jgi:hypothetical protein
MDSKAFGLKLNIDGLGYVDLLRETDLHAVKSAAGKAFRADTVNSVCVYDASGATKLYLKKTENGIVREEN